MALPAPALCHVGCGSCDHVLVALTCCCEFAIRTTALCLLSVRLQLQVDLFLLVLEPECGGPSSVTDGTKRLNHSFACAHTRSLLARPLTHFHLAKPSSKIGTSMLTDNVCVPVLLFWAATSLCHLGCST